MRLDAKEFVSSEILSGPYAKKLWVIFQNWKFVSKSDFILRIEGFCLIGGIFDLEPLVSTYVNDVIKMDKYVSSMITLWEGPEGWGLCLIF